MSRQIEEYAATFERLAEKVVVSDFEKQGCHLEVKLEPGAVRDFATTLLEEEFYLVFVSAVHVNPAPQVVYQFARHDANVRVNVRVFAEEGPAVPTISDIFHGANWHEREVRDFFGIRFTGHPDMRVLLLADEDEDLKPLWKEDANLKHLADVTWEITEEDSEAAE